MIPNFRRFGITGFVALPVNDLAFLLRLWFNEGLMPSFGGDWTEQKLEILQEYLDVYTTALKKQYFRLIYIDAFAGSGLVELKDKYVRRFIDGSVKRALQVDEKPFDELVFVEKDRKRCGELSELKESYPSRNIRIEQREANEYLQGLCSRWRETHSGYRGVLFLDPFATQVEWVTVKAVLATEALDVWILFPVSAVARMLPNSKNPDDVSPTWASRLTHIYGDESWRGLYGYRQAGLFGSELEMRTPGLDGILGIYKDNLRSVAGSRLLEESKPLTNSKNSPLFQLMFCAGNPAGIKPAHNIARHLLGKI